MQWEEELSSKDRFIRDPQTQSNAQFITSADTEHCTVHLHDLGFKVPLEQGTNTTLPVVAQHG